MRNECSVNCVRARLCACVHMCVCVLSSCKGYCKANQLILKVEPILVSLGNLLRALPLHFHTEVCIPNYEQCKWMLSHAKLNLSSLDISSLKIERKYLNF